MTLSELVIKITADTEGAIEGIQDTEQKTSKLAKLAEKLGPGMQKAAKVAGAALAAGAAAIGKIAYSAVQAYSEYEQLTGGVETLFGTSAKSLEEYQRQIGINEKSNQRQIEASKQKYEQLTQAQQMVMQNAHNAFKTAGLDANSYMQTVTSFSASLLQSLKNDTVAAAQYSDMAITDMADNANKFGVNIEQIQSAYRGFAKGQFQLLDNLQLGYNGTRSEMQRLLKDAEKIQKKNGKNVKYSINNLADIIDAIHVVQTELGITGTTAEEAGRTIQGSLSMMKAAWTNLKIAIVDPNGNINGALQDFIESAKTFGKNIVPALSTALQGIGSIVKELAPVISAELPGLITALVPDLAASAVTLVTALAQGIVENIPVLAEAAVQIVDAIATVFKESDSPVLQFIGSALEGIKNIISFVIELFTDFPSAVAKLEGSDHLVLQTLGGALKVIHGVVSDIIGFFQNFDGNVAALQGSDQDVLVLVGNALGTIKGLIEAIVTAFNGGLGAAIDQLQKSDNPVLQAVASALQGMQTAVQWIIDHQQLVITAIEAIGIALAALEIVKFITHINKVTVIITVLAALAALIIDNWEPIKEFFVNLWETVSTAVTDAWNAVVTWTSGILSKFKTAWDRVVEFFSGIWEGVSTAATDAWNTITTALQTARTKLEGTWNMIKTFATTIWNTIKSLAKTAWDGIKKFIEDPITTAKETLAGIWESIKSVATAAWAALSKALEPIISGITSFIEGVVNAVKDAIDWITQLLGFDGRHINMSYTITRNEVGAAGRSVTEEAGRQAEQGGTDFEAGLADRPTVVNSRHVNEHAVTMFPAGNAKGNWNVPYDNFPALLHRGEAVLTASQARRYRDGEGSGINTAALESAIISAIRRGMEGATVNSYIDGREITDVVNRYSGADMLARRFT